MRRWNGNRGTNTRIQIQHTFRWTVFVLAAIAISRTILVDVKADRISIGFNASIFRRTLVFSVHRSAHLRNINSVAFFFLVERWKYCSISAIDFIALVFVPSVHFRYSIVFQNASEIPNIFLTTKCLETTNARAICLKNVRLKNIYNLLNKAQRDFTNIAKHWEFECGFVESTNFRVVAAIEFGTNGCYFKFIRRTIEIDSIVQQVP